MTMTSGTNKWASRAVVVLQLAAWSAVGIVLLQKGVSSLQKGSDIRNITKTIQNPAVSKDISVISIVEDLKTSQSEELPILPSGNSKTWDVKSMAHKLEKLQQKNPPESASVDFDEKIEPRVSESFDKEDKNNLFNKKPGKIKLAKLNEYDKSKSSDIAPDINSSLQRQPKILEPDEVYGDSYQQPRNFSSLSESSQINNKEWTAPVEASTGKPSMWETRRRLRLSHLSGGGAAAAVAMVAVGAVMLVLGPAVIVLRALDERRQERRFLKLSARDDLPPSYEQATLMDEAPRYSSLNLNTILGPPPPPSPTPARVQSV